MGNLWRRAVTTWVMASGMCVTSVVRGDEYSEFRIPDHTSRYATLALRSDGSWRSNSDALASDGYGSGSAFLGPAAGWLRETDATTSVIDWRGEFSGLRSHAENHGAFILGEDRETSLVGTDESSRLEVSHSRFFGPRPWRLGISAVEALRWEQRWRSERSVSGAGVGESDEARGRRFGAWSAEASTGIGRVRRVDSVVQAMLLERRLREAGAITRSLSVAARLRLAQLFEVSGSYAFVHDRPAAGLWRSIREVLEGDGALADPAVDAADALRAIEPFIGPSSSISRDAIVSGLPWTRGSELVIALRAVETRSHLHSRFHTRVAYSAPDTVIESADESRYGAVSDRYAWVVRGAVARPQALGLWWQLDATYYQELHTGDGFRQVETSARGMQVIADRWLGDLVLGWGRSERSSEFDRHDAWHLTLNPTAHYFLTDRLDFVAAGNYAYSESISDPGNGHSIRRIAAYSIGLQYRFSGRLQVAALPGPVGGLVTSGI